VRATLRADHRLVATTTAEELVSAPHSSPKWVWTHSCISERLETHPPRKVHTQRLFLSCRLPASWQRSLFSLRIPAVLIADFTYPAPFHLIELGTRQF